MASGSFAENMAKRYAEKQAKKLAAQKSVDKGKRIIEGEFSLKKKANVMQKCPCDAFIRAETQALPRRTEASKRARTDVTTLGDEGSGLPLEVMVSLKPLGSQYANFEQRGSILNDPKVSAGIASKLLLPNDRRKLQAQSSSAFRNFAYHTHLQNLQCQVFMLETWEDYRDKALRYDTETKALSQELDRIKGELSKSQKRVEDSISALGIIKLGRDQLKKELEEKNREFSILESSKKSSEELVEDFRRQLKEKDKIIANQSSRIEELDDQIIDAEMRVGWGLKCDAIAKGYPDIWPEIVDPAVDGSSIEVAPSSSVDPVVPPGLVVSTANLVDSSGVSGAETNIYATPPPHEASLKVKVEVPTSIVPNANPSHPKGTLIYALEV